MPYHDITGMESIQLQSMNLDMESMNLDTPDNTNQLYHPNQTCNLFLMRSDGNSFIHIGSICQTDPPSDPNIQQILNIVATAGPAITVSVKHHTRKLTVQSPVVSVKMINDHMLEFVANYLENQKAITKPIMLEYGDIRLYILDVYKTRRSLGFITYQISDCGSRCLFYVTDYVSHFAQSFGTSYDQIKRDDIIVYFNRYLETNREVVERLEIEYRMRAVMRDVKCLDGNFGV